MNTIFIPDDDVAKFDSLLQNAFKAWSEKVEGGYHLNLNAPAQLLAEIPNDVFSAAIRRAELHEAAKGR